MKKREEISPKDVELPWRRDGIVLSLLDLENPEYQKYVMTTPIAWINEWLNKDGSICTDYSTCYSFHIGFVSETIEDMDFYDNLRKNTMPYDKIGIFMKSRKEVELLMEFVKIFDQFYDECYPEPEEPKNSVWFASPLWPKMTQAAKRALEAFLENEQGDEEYLQLVRTQRESLNNAVEKRKKELAGKMPY